MCEWLSCRDWCDVQLQCGGRSFAAHRAVLASVSAFLRQILLSSATDDSPTFIVLPEFDLDAMSSVLYYIYNGEVVLQKQKLEMFMEIVRAMQIFVDEEYLPSDLRTKQAAFSSSLFQKVGNEIFCLGDCLDGRYVNLKKSSFERILKESQKGPKFGDKQIKGSFGEFRNVEFSEDRQKGFIRDFIETYPQNGNANGRLGVLAIQSMAQRQYHTPASLLLTHANGKNLSFAQMQKKHADFTTLSQFQAQNCIQNYNLNDRVVNCVEPLKTFSLTNPTFFHYQPTLTSNRIPELIDLKSMNSKLRNVSDPLQDFNSKKNNISKSSNTRSRKHSSRAAVLNEVLDSPWRPRQPNNYRPLRRLSYDSKIVNNVKKPIQNDSNNNIEASPAPKVIEHITSSASILEPLTNVARLSLGNDFRCAECDQVFTTEESLSSHVRRHSSSRYSCTECTKSFSQLRNFKYHMSIHRGTKEFAATCNVCGKYFNDRGYLSSHMKIHRNRKEYKCPQCPKSFNQRVAYNMHVRIHTGIKPHVCPDCGKAFSRKMLLKQHQRTHSGERPYACAHCDKRFADRSNMTLHLRLHTGIKPFSCTLCPKSFTKKHHLKSHLNFHTGAKPYSCPKCKLAFTQSSNMRTHLKKCSAPEPIVNADMQTQNGNQNGAQT